MAELSQAISWGLAVRLEAVVQHQGLTTEGEKEDDDAERVAGSWSHLLRTWEGALGLS